MIYTIGHSTRTHAELFDLLEENGVTELLDVRSYPSSKFCPQWNQIEILNSTRRRTGYEWLKHLGGKRKALPVKDSVNGAWKNASFRGYGDYMQTREFRIALEDLITIYAASADVAIMCSEAVWWKCHRSMIADALVGQDVEVRHIMALGKEPQPHKLRDFAVVDLWGNVSYPKVESAHA